MKPDIKLPEIENRKKRKSKNQIFIEHSASSVICLALCIWIAHFVSHFWVQTEKDLISKYKESRFYFIVQHLRNKEETPEDIDLYFKEASILHGVPLSMLHGVAMEESSKNPEALSSVGAIGMMQIMPENAKRCGVSVGKLWDIRTNIMCGAQILKEELATYGNDFRLALISYNGGPRCVKNLCGESVRHAEKVMLSTIKHLLKGY
jgi:hypothetical protein